MKLTLQLPHWCASVLAALTLALPNASRADPSVFLAVRAQDADLGAEGDVDNVAEAVTALQQGGYVVVFRHGATTSDEFDEDPIVLTDCAKQRNLSDWGRDTMQGLGEFFAERKVRFAVAYSSAMCRAVDTARRLTTAAVLPIKGITMASGSGMAKPIKLDAEQSRTLRDLVSKTPESGANTLVVTHSPNLVAAFGTDLSGVPEGGAVVFEPRPGQQPGYSVRWRLPLWSFAGYARSLKPVADARSTQTVRTGDRGL